MYSLFSILAGIVISVMVSLNGALANSYGTYAAAVIIHVVGVLFAFALCLIRKVRIFPKNKVPPWVYLGGAIGVLTTLFNAYAFGKISMTSIVALSLLGQSISSVIIDSLGLSGAPKKAFNKNSFVGFIFSAFGIFIMMDQTLANGMIAVALSLCSGITIVTSRTINSKLSQQSNPLAGSLLNHLIGLPICIVLFLCLQPSKSAISINTNPLIYLGGVLGVATVLLFNITVPHISAFKLTLLTFIGQVFTGMVLDYFQGLKSSQATFQGGVIISIGLLINALLERYSIYKAQKEEKGI